MSNFNTKYFASIIDDETVAVLHIDDGHPVTRIMDEEFDDHLGFIYDVNTGMGTEYEQPEGIVLTNADAKVLNLEFVDYR